MDKKSIILYLIIVSISIWSCNQDGGGSGKSLEEYSPENGKNASIIRNPVSAGDDQDTINVAKIAFEEEYFDFGKVKEGNKVKHVFNFKNVGKVPLVISDVKSTCGCTIPDWTEDPIEPGADGKISVEFNTNGKPGEQSKPVTVFANTYPNQSQVILFGYVEPKNE